MFLSKITKYLNIYKNPNSSDKMAHLYNYIYYDFSYTVAIAPFHFCYLYFIDI